MRKLCLLLLIVAGCSAKATLPAVEDGDVIFQTSRSSQSIAIQHATSSPFSHMGIIFIRSGRPYVLEASATVRYTPLEKWIEHGVGGHYQVKRLRDAAQVLTPEKRAELRRAAESFIGRPYDLTFDWSDDRMYCSELVWKVYDRTLGIQIGALQQVRDFNLTDPAVKAKMHERYGSNVPLDAPVISPVAMERSNQLVMVAER
jgi:uncharacterized protein YycO